jgi:adenosylhomocysteine nucleosidase
MNEEGLSVSTAFVCAMPMELRPLVKRLSLQKGRTHGVTMHTGVLRGRPVAAIVTGMGTNLAREAARRLLHTVSVERIVVVGITGAVDDVTPLGALIVPEIVVDSATGTEYRPAPLGPRKAHGTMWTTDVLTGSDVAADLRARGVVSLDMETAAIAEVCERRAVPWSVFRAISDRATDGTVDEEVFRLSNQDGTPNGRAIARFFMKHPRRIPGMVRMARAATLATETAAEAAIDACSQS